jgi:hypothetical protein
VRGIINKKPPFGDGRQASAGAKEDLSCLDRLDLGGNFWFGGFDVLEHVKTPALLPI